MDWTSLLPWIGGPAGLTALAGWLFRQRLGRGADRLGDFLAAQHNLKICRSELTNQAASFARQRADMAAELATRDRERVYLLSLVEEMTSKANRVTQAHARGLLSVSDAPSPTPAPPSTASPRSPRRRASTTNHRSRSSRIVRNGARRADPDEPV